jgi:hypothetical protein
MIQHLQVTFLLGTLEKNLEIFESIIEKYGKIKTNKMTKTDESLIHDFLYFCLTKSTRTLNASYILIKENFFEDVFTLIRSAYETYLHISYIQKNPDDIRKIINSKLGVYFEIFQHPTTKNGKQLKHKAIDPESGKEYSLNISLQELSKNTMYSSDVKIYPKFYAYLSEYAHVHMIAVGSYQSQKTLKFLVNSSAETKLFQVTLMTLFTNWLILDSLSNFNISKKDKKEIDKKVTESGIFLFNYIGGLDFDERLLDLQAYILERLNCVLKLD